MACLYLKRDMERQTANAFYSPNLSQGGCLEEADTLLFASKFVSKTR